MKRVFTILMATTAVLMAQATDYTDKLLVLVNGEGAVQESTISVTEHDGLYDLNMKNFILMNGDSPMPVGNVELKDIQPEEVNGAVFLRVKQNITLSAGDAPDVMVWTGPLLGELPVDVTAVLSGGRLRALINLDLTIQLNQVINVSFGEELVAGIGWHIPNGDFEAWHTSADEYVEPNAWHSFESASGAFASLAGHHIAKSDRGLNGSTCARLMATSIFGIVANGTMTTGRLNAGAVSAEDAANHAFLDMSQTDTDGNGDPFYVPLTGRPDSLTLWMQFRQGNTNASHPYASVSAIITDGTRYQDPEDKIYDNVVARAKDNTIGVTGNEWRRISIPFVYSDNNVDPKAILVTISTNADPGQGSGSDEVLVDDLSLVYNDCLTSLNVEGFAPDKFNYTADEMSLNDIVAEANGKNAYVLKTIETDENGKRVVIDVYSGDLYTCKTYTINFDTTNSISTPTRQQLPVCYYSLSGQRISSPQAGQVTIIRQADGRIVKVIK